MNAIKTGIYAKYYEIPDGRCKHDLTLGTCSICAEMPEVGSGEFISFPQVESYSAKKIAGPIDWTPQHGQHCVTRKPGQHCPVCEGAGLEVIPAEVVEPLVEISDDLQKAISKIIRIALKRFLPKEAVKPMTIDGQPSTTGAIEDLTGQVWLSILTSQKFAELPTENKLGFVYLTAKHAAFSYAEERFRIVPVSQMKYLSVDPEDPDSEQLYPWDDQALYSSVMGSYSLPENGSDVLEKELTYSEQQDVLAALKKKNPDDYAFLMDYTQRVLANHAKVEGQKGGQRVNGKQFSPSEVKRAKRIRDWLRRQVE